MMPFGYFSQYMPFFSIDLGASFFFLFNSFRAIIFFISALFRTGFEEAPDFPRFL